MSKICIGFSSLLLTTFFCFADEGNQISKELYYAVTKFKIEEHKENASSPNEFNSENFTEYIRSRDITPIFIVFKIELTESEMRLIEEIKEAADKIENDLREDAQKSSRITRSMNMPDGGIAGTIITKTDSDHFAELVKVTNAGNPIIGYALIPIKDGLQSDFNNLLLRFFLSPNIEVRDKLMKK